MSIEVLKSKKSGAFIRRENPFSQISNSALRDENLSLRAKGLYSLIQSYIVIPDFTLYKGFLLKMNTEKEKAFDTAWKELKTAGYLKQYRIPSGESGTFNYLYELHDVADLSTPPLINLDKNGNVIEYNEQSFEKSKAKSEQNKKMNDNATNPTINTSEQKIISIEDNTKPNYNGFKEVKIIENKDFDHTPHLAPYAQGGVYNNIYSNNIYNTNNTLSIYHSNYSSITKFNKKDMMDKIDLVKENIDYDILEEDYADDIYIIDNIVDVMVDVLLSNNPEIRIGGFPTSTELVKSRYMKITREHIEYILLCLKRTKTEIKNIKAYLSTSIFYAPSTMDTYYVQLAQYNLNV